MDGRREKRGERNEKVVGETRKIPLVRPLITVYDLFLLFILSKFMYLSTYYLKSSNCTFYIVLYITEKKIEIAYKCHVSKARFWMFHQYRSTKNTNVFISAISIL